MEQKIDITMTYFPRKEEGFSVVKEHFQAALFGTGFFSFPIPPAEGISEEHAIDHLLVAFHNAMTPGEQSGTLLKYPGAAELRVALGRNQG